MAKITYPEKNIGDQFKSTEANEIKASVNALYDFNENLSVPTTDSFPAYDGLNTIGQLMWNTTHHKLYAWNGAYWSHADNANSQGFSFSTKDLFCWGDSLTQANAGGTPYPTQLAALSGFTVTNKGSGGETSTQIKNRLIADSGNYDKSIIIWAGRNNFTDPATVKADIAAMLSTVGHNRFLILGILNGDYVHEYSGTDYYDTIIQLNTDLSNLYGDKYLDIRNILVNAYNPAIAQDVIDFGHDVPPSSLRLDEVHLNTEGYQVVANAIYQRLAYLFDETGLNQNHAILNQVGFVQEAGFRIKGTGQLQGGGEVLKLGTNTGSADHVFIGLYAREADPTAQCGIVGYTPSSGNKLEVTNYVGNLNFKSTQSASAGIAKGVEVINTLTATNDFDVLTTLHLKSNYSNGSFASVRNIALRAVNDMDLISDTVGGASLLNIRSYLGYDTNSTKTLLMMGSSINNKNFNAVAAYSFRYKSGSAFNDAMLTIASNSWSSYARELFDTSPDTTTDLVGITPTALIVQNGGTFTDDGINRLQVTGSVKSDQYRLSALNTAPASATATGTTGEIRYTATHIYVCTATNTWVRAALATW